MKYWLQTKDGDPDAYDLYRRHYSARKNPHPKIRQFVGPGQKLVLIGFMCRALIAFRKFHSQDPHANGINVAVFRNESPHQSSDMIREALAIAQERWGPCPFYTYVNTKHTASSNPGYCFLKAGFVKAGTTHRGLLRLQYQGNGTPVTSQDHPW